MQVVPPSSPAPKFIEKERFFELYEKLSDDLATKFKMDFTEKKNKEEKSLWNYNEVVEPENEEEFSFANVNAENSPITADEAFEDGHIRPVYPLFNRNLLFEPEEKPKPNPKPKSKSKSKTKSLRSNIKKLFVEAEPEPIGPFCSWSGRTVEETSSSSSSPATCRKSNSTGFSKLWRFKDLVLRSNSDGKDAFVFLSNEGSRSSSSSSTADKLAGGKGKEKTKTTEKKVKAKSAHERLYMRNRAIKEEGKRRSYLPYKHVGFFTNVNGLTRNVHPY